MAAALACLVLALAAPASARSLRADDSEANGVLPMDSSPYFSALSAIKQAGYTAQYAAGAPALAPAAALAAASAPAVRTAGRRRARALSTWLAWRALCALPTCMRSVGTLNARYCRSFCSSRDSRLCASRQAARVYADFATCGALLAFLGIRITCSPALLGHTRGRAEHCWDAGDHGGAAGAAARARARSSCCASARRPRPRARPGGGGHAVSGAARGGRAGRGSAAGSRAGGRRRGGRARARPVRVDRGAAEGPGRARRARPGGRVAAGAGARPRRQEGESRAGASSRTAAPSRRAIAQVHAAGRHAMRPTLQDVRAAGMTDAHPRTGRAPGAGRRCAEHARGARAQVYQQRKTFAKDPITPETVLAALRPIHEQVQEIAMAEATNPNPFQQADQQYALVQAGVPAAALVEHVAQPLTDVFQKARAPAHMHPAALRRAPLPPSLLWLTSTLPMLHRRVLRASAAASNVRLRAARRPRRRWTRRRSRPRRRSSRSGRPPARPASSRRPARRRSRPRARSPAGGRSARPRRGRQRRAAPPERLAGRRPARLVSKAARRPAGGCLAGHGTAGSGARGLHWRM